MWLEKFNSSFFFSLRQRQRSNGLVDVSSGGGSIEAASQVGRSFVHLFIYVRSQRARSSSTMSQSFSIVSPRSTTSSTSMAKTRPISVGKTTVLHRYFGPISRLPLILFDVGQVRLDLWNVAIAVE
jgi:hypothetical protein